MNEPVLLFCQQWVVTEALASLLASLFTVPVIPVYGLEQLGCKLRRYRCSSVILGISPHEHVVPLYRLGPLLVGRPVLFVARHFWWTDYCLPEFVGVSPCRFCSLDMLADMRTRCTEIRKFKHLHQLFSSGDTAPAADCTVYGIPDMAPEYILEQANFWMHKRMTDAGLNGVEYMVLLLLAESRRTRMSSHLLSLYKIRGLYKLGMTGRVMNLYRGVKVRPELQVPFPSGVPGSGPCIGGENDQ
ncbi:hypothetical protein LT792_004429 [Salmonella enterica]|nr:hypothetical protein [Salmonella enterica]